MERVLFQKQSKTSNVIILNEQDLNRFIIENQFSVIQIVDLYGARPTNVLRFLVEYEEEPKKTKNKKMIKND